MRKSTEPSRGKSAYTYLGIQPHHPFSLKNPEIASLTQRTKNIGYLAVLTVAVVLILSLLGRGGEERAFINGQVLTLNHNAPNASAMLVRKGRIVAVGDDASVLEQASDSVVVTDWQGKAVVPGFVDAHSHFPVSGLSAVSVNIAPPPVGPGATKEAVVAAIAKAIPASAPGKKPPFILGFNYDNTAFRNPTHPTRKELDAISRGYPVYLWHSSGHLGVANSAALERLGIDEESPMIVGGERGRDLTGKLNGLLAEKAAPSMTRLLKQMKWRDVFRIVTQARDEYLSTGHTTVQNGFASLGMRRMLNFLHWTGVVPQRVNTWIAHDKIDASKAQGLPKNTTIKIIVDGSPQGLTALVTEPYLVRAFGPDNRGVPIFTQDALNELVLGYHRQGLQIALHGNGDAAIDQIIEAVSKAQAEVPRPDARHILVHAQLLRVDQIEQMENISLTPSFFTTHTFYWGEWHMKSFGPHRASGLSPAASAAKKGLRFSLHADTPVTPANSLFLMWAASERETRSGLILGASERIERIQALKAVTIDAAWQAFQDDHIGSLEVGKLADFVVLNENPLTVPDLKNMEVAETWIGGKRHYLKNE